MLCENCNKELKKNWEYCPYCGEEVLDELFYNDMSNEIDEELEQVTKMLSKSFNLKINPSVINQNGISISISSINDSKPKVEVKRFGDLKEKEEVKQRKPSLKERLLKKLERKRKISDTIEEPKSAIRRLTNKLIYEFDVPEIKSIKDVDINRLDNSTEIKAFGKNKTYLKILPFSLETNKQNLKNGKLMVEFKI